MATLLSQLRSIRTCRTGWGKRGYNWEFSAGVQQQLSARMSLDVGFFRSWYGNFQVADNLALSATDFNFINITAPVDSRLPGGGGYTVTGFPVIKPTVGFGGFVTNQNVVKLSDDVGRQIEHWNGVDVNLNARLQAGSSDPADSAPGRTSTDNCDIVTKLPEVGFESLNFFSPFFFTTMPNQYCKRDGVFLTQVKGFAGYTIPKIDVLVAGTFQSLPGVDVTARYNVAVPARRRRSADVARHEQLPHHRARPGHRRSSEPDRHPGREDPEGGAHADAIGLDVYNLFNTDAVTGQNNTYTPVPGGHGGLAGAEPDSPGAVHQVQRAVRLLVRL